jgi:Mg/Co/Ni transporter MgtE
MESKKQTAVEWLFEQVANLDWRNLQGDKKLEIFEQAKAMEKEQIIEAIDYGCSDWGSFKDVEKYYNETYNK